MDAAIEEQLWKDPDWTCPWCGWVNFAIRSRCRNFDCAFRWEDEAAACLVVGEDGVARPWKNESLAQQGH